MNTEPQTWPFDSPPNVACFTVRSIVDGVRPVLMVSRDLDDGAWQFLTGDAFDMAEAMLVTLESMVAQDPSLLQLADIQHDWMAWRERPGVPWSRQAEAEQTKE